jgi:hypothetical protein
MDWWVYVYFTVNMYSQMSEHELVVGVHVFTSGGHTYSLMGANVLQIGPKKNGPARPTETKLVRLFYIEPAGLITGRITIGIFY